MKNKYVPDFKQLDKLTDEGYLRKFYSEDRKLFGYKYTDKTQYENYWNKHTQNARGTVYEADTGKVVGRFYEKFYNYSQLAVSKQRNLLKQTDFDVMDKADGSCLGIYWYDGEWRCNTVGSFSSDQAIKAKEMLAKYNMDSFSKDTTLMCEVIYPDNRIVVDYGAIEELRLHGAFDNESGSDLHTELGDISKYTGIPLVEKYSYNSVDELIDMQGKLSANEEGFVVRFKSGERVKFKGMEYLRVHRLISHMTPLHYWKEMENGLVPLSLLEQIPEEFREESEKIVASLEEQYGNVKIGLELDFRYAVGNLGGLPEELDNEFRKSFGLFLKERGEELLHPQAMFPRLLENDEAVDKYIKRHIKPKANKL